jgi:CCR4-NOT transcription complex subunit 7/8
LYNHQGRRGGTFSFNFQWREILELSNPTSIQLLKDSGLDFVRHHFDGIALQDFIVALRPLLASSLITWIVYHGAFDLAYLVKACFGRLPEDRNEFLRLMNQMFPNVTDLKILSGPRTGGLERLASGLGVLREGTNHNAGSDSMVTGGVFFALMAQGFQQKYHETNGLIFGID